VGRFRDALDARLESWDAEIATAVAAMPGELRAVLELHYRDRRLFKQKRESFGGSVALYWQRWTAARAWLGGWLAALRATSGE
jgi:hypothetical protein